MHYSELTGVCHSIAPLPRLKGIGDEPLAPLSDGAVMIMHRPRVSSLRGAKIDQHASFPKGLPKVFGVRDEHLRDL